MLFAVSDFVTKGLGNLTGLLIITYRKITNDLAEERAQLSLQNIRKIPVAIP
jgi:hypothetical protein